MAARKPKIEPKFICIRLQCSCGEVFTTNKPSWTASEQECECCGSHGSVRVYATCPACNKRVEVEVEGW